MIGVLVVTHGAIGEALLHSAEQILGAKQARAAAFGVSRSDAPEAVLARLRKLAAQLDGGEGLLVLTDMFGATPCNVAQRLADGVRVKVVTGVNVPMLWRALCYASEPLDSLVTRALAGATQGALQVTPTRPQNQARNPSDPDEKNHRHDQ